MRCRDAERALALYLDKRHGGPLPPDVDAHLAACPTCHDEWTALRHVDNLFTQAPLAAPPPGLAAAVLARIEAGVEPAAAVPARRRRLNRRRLLGSGLVVSAPLLAALAVSLVIWGLIAYSLGTLVPGWLQDPQVANTAQILLEEADFWTTTLSQTLLAVVVALLPLVVSGAVVFAFLCVLAYALTLAWGWLIGRVWWPGQLQVADCG